MKDNVKYTAKCELYEETDISILLTYIIMKMIVCL